MTSTHTVAAESQLVANICDYVKANDKNRLRKKLKENRVKLRNIYAGVSCEGNSLLRMAMLSKSDKVGSFIAKRLSSKELSKAEADGQTLLAWAQANGHAGSATFTVIKEKTGS
ncbi:DUF3718 domain-containing protein [Shewanella gelidii]|nr:DUF3718 domain-containing protein [Shewanella gelidii]MCL1096763.1 DUF3718 domain-containing protein [Shewanella gelidii]